MVSRMDETRRKPEPVVVGVDGSTSSKAALVWAAGQAKRTGAHLIAVMTWEFPTSYGWPSPVPDDLELADDARSLLEESLDEVLGPDPDIETNVVVMEGHPARVLVELSKTASLVVVGSRGHGEFAGMLLGSVSEHLAAHAHCPVVVVRDGSGRRQAS